MIIKLTPQRRDDNLELIKNNDSLYINGELFDFSQLPNGARLPFGSVNSKFVVGDVYRIDNQIEITIILPYNTSHSSARKFPTTLNVNTDGLVELPK
jgi:hypothetical protein